MKRKCLAIGISTVSVILLILTSLSNVVGYQSVKSTTVNDSPLFSIRANKATNNDNNRVITSNYLGKGLNALSFPLRNNRMEQTLKVIEIIQKMDDNEFNRLQNLILSRFYEKKNNIDIDATQLVTLLKQIKSNTKSLKIILNNNENNTHTDEPTFMEPCLNTINPIPFCLILWIIVILFSPLWALLLLLTVDFMCSWEK
jgi:multisubunit Na+/H+ antiporter MnhC subunit